MNDQPTTVDLDTIKRREAAATQRDALEREKAAELIATVDRLLPKWRTWFPNERSHVEVPREDLLALVEVAREQVEVLQRDNRRRRSEILRPHDTIGDPDENRSESHRRRGAGG